MTGTASYQPKRASPTALIVVVLMHGAAIGALALAKMDVIKERIAPTIVDLVEEDKPPPPEPPEPVKQRVEPRQDTVLDRPPPILEVPAPGPVTEWKPTPIPTVIIPTPGPVDIIEPPSPPPPPPPPPPKKVEPVKAKANLASYVSDADYPASAIRNEEQGTTRFRLEVGSDGRVTDCTVTGSSGSSALDAVTCRLMKQRARFTPARDSSGNVTSGSMSSSIRWVLPDS
ncbi:MAG TPA: TonB family protein [Allosphingosinicella sp.]|jgi:protein TonB